METGFFAYPSDPYTCGPNIEDAVTIINRTSSAKITTWKNMDISGRLIIGQILKEIEKADFFCADITNTNENVLLELGYAIALKKPIFLIMNSTYVDAEKKLKDIGLISVIGHLSYENSNQIVKHFGNWFIEQVNKNYYEDFFQNQLPKSNKTNFLFRIKSRYDINESQVISKLIKNNNIDVVVDDPHEDRSYDFFWFTQNLNNCVAVFAELISKNQFGHETHNAKCGFICGLAIGLNKKLLIVAPKDFNPPFDYKTYLKKHNDSRSCETAVLPFFKEIKNIQIDYKKRQILKEEKSKTRTKFSEINIGHYIAEDEDPENQGLYFDFFNFKSIIKEKKKLIVGRKGTGKTASLLYLHERLSTEKNNIVCLMQPDNFSLSNLILHTREFDNTEDQALFVNSIWWYVILTEIAIALKRKIEILPVHSIEKSQKEFLDFTIKNKNFFFLSISERVDYCIDELSNNNSSNKQLEAKQKRSNIANFFHQGKVNELRILILKAITSDQKVFFLIDNLDKTWRKGHDIDFSSKLISGLLNAFDRISKDIEVGKIQKINIQFSMLIFLRTDIFKYIYQSLTEVDKLNYLQFHWKDSESLLRIIDLRIEELNSDFISASEFWSDYVVNEFEGMPIKEFIWSVVIPRPRDIIYFVKQAHQIAVQRGHTSIQKEDIKSAYESYSKWVFFNLIEENGISFSEMEDFLYNLGEFSLPIVEKDKIIIAKHKSGIIDDKIDADTFVDYLVSMSILGRELEKDKFVFLNNFEDDRRNKIMANRIQGFRYKIHPALYPNLLISE